MAVTLEFIDFIVPIALIQEKYPGGWETCLKDHANLIGGRVWYDEYLFRDGAMNPGDIGDLVDEWTALGFEPYSEINGKKQWQDMCVVEGLFGGATLHCPWLAIDDETGGAYMVGFPVGKLVGREPFPE